MRNKKVKTIKGPLQTEYRIRGLARASVNLRGEVAEELALFEEF